MIQEILILLWQYTEYLTVVNYKHSSIFKTYKSHTNSQLYNNAPVLVKKTEWTHQLWVKENHKNTLIHEHQFNNNIDQYTYSTHDTLVAILDAMWSYWKVEVAY